MHAAARAPAQVWTTSRTALAQRGRMSEAEPFVTECFERRREYFGAGDARTGRARGALLRVFECLGESARVRRLRVEGVAVDWRLLLFLNSKIPRDA